MEHRKRLRLGDHHSKKLQNSWKKHGESAFEFSILERVDDLEKLISREQHWIDTLCAATVGYNMSPSAGNCVGVIKSPETRAKISAAKRGKKLSAEHRKKIGDGNRGKSRTVSSEGREKLSRARCGRPNIKLRGRIISQEMRAAISAKLTGVKQSPELVAKRTASLRKKFESGTPDYIFKAAAARRALPKEVSDKIMQRARDTLRAQREAARALLPPPPPPTERYLKWNAAVADKREGWSRKAKARWAAMTPDERAARGAKSAATRLARRAAAEAAASSP